MYNSVIKMLSVGICEIIVMNWGGNFLIYMLLICIYIEVREIL